MSQKHKMLTVFSILFQILLLVNLTAQITPLGSGSYTNTFPGTDAAGRNGFPPGNPQVSGEALGKTIPTNDWWSTLIQSDHAGNLFNYPLAMKTKSSGLMISYIPQGVLDDQEPLIIGVTDLNASKTTVSNYTDWTVTMDWNSKFQASSGIGMPFVYFEKGIDEVAKVVINLGSATISNEMIFVQDTRNGADFAIYAPTGSTWIKNGTTYTSTLNGKNYWSLAMLPQNATNPEDVALAYKKYAYVYPTNTTVEWIYDDINSMIRSNFSVETEIKEGSDTTVLMGLLPHQWGNLAPDSPQPQEHVYTSIRGELKTLNGNNFSVENSFHGILPSLPYLSNYSEGFNPAVLNSKVKLLENEGLATWTDSYNEGQVMNRLIQTARIADKMKNLEARNKIIATIKQRLEDWLTAEVSEVAFLFYYNTTWTALLGYPAGHGQDNNINDHHFHWGYFIHAAAFMEQFEPGWSDQWGEMVNYLVRDAASSDRSDSLFPFLRNFSPYAGHCWANGFASFPQGNDQESTSESMQFNSSLIHWGSITDNDDIRDLGIYLYTTEQSAIEEYWFDFHDRVFEESHPYSLVSRVWGNSYDNGTFWTADIEASYGIELYPIHGGSMYLGHNIQYATNLWAEIENNTGILSNDDNVNLWHDVMWKYLAFTDPQKAINLYNGFPDRNMKFGVSDAQTYYWLHAMNAMGQIDTSVSADHPLAVVFNKEGDLTYVAHNYSDTEKSVRFSDGFELLVPERSMRTNRDLDITGEISSSFPSAYPGGSVLLTVNSQNGSPGKVEFYKDGVLLGEDSALPFEFTAEDLSAGVYSFYAKLYVGEAFNVSNIITVISGNQAAFEGSISVLPGTIEAGQYDEFPGGSGQGIAYLDLSPGNYGDYRENEDVDASSSTSEGSVISNISGGEWTEYTVDVTQSGNYNLVIRYASGNESGGGPFHLELDGEIISEDIHLAYTGDWDDWQSETVSGLAMPEGLHVLRLVFEHGEFNIGRMTFSYESELPYAHPIAEAGDNISLKLPESTAILDGTQSSDPDGGTLSYSWIQINGPSIILFSDTAAVSTSISNIIEGIYTVQLTVSNGEHSSSDIVYIVLTESGNLSPSISILSPEDNINFEEGSDIFILANASDLEGDISLVEFFDGDNKIGEDDTYPFSFTYPSPVIGIHELSAKATDGDNAFSTSDTILVYVVEVKECKRFSKEAQQGSFSKGYYITYKTVGTDVSITFELLDADKTGVIAFLWQESPFNEVQMDNVEGLVFSTKLSGVSPGTILSYACKFAYAGGLSATTYYSYEVGTECEEPDVDLEAPQSFTASAGQPGITSVEISMSASDDAGFVVYKIAYNSINKSITGISGEQTTHTIDDLEASSSYTIYVSAEDSSGNVSANSPIILSLTTQEDTTGVVVREILQENIALYPNPVDRTLTIRFSGEKYPLSLSVINAMGTSQKLSQYLDNGLSTIDFSHLPAGVYFLVFEYSIGPKYLKVIKR